MLNICRRVRSKMGSRIDVEVDHPSDTWLQADVRELVRVWRTLFTVKFWIRLLDRRHDVSSCSSFKLHLVPLCQFSCLPYPSSSGICNSSTSPMTALVLPGQPLPAEFKQLQPGHGCYTSKDGILRASVVGYPKTADGVVNVRTGRPDTSALPEIGAIVSTLRLYGEAYFIHSLLRQVTGVVSQLTPQQATLTMTLVNNLPTPVSSADFVGVIRVSDVRATEKDKVKIGESFRLGDTVKAAVVSVLHPLSRSVQR
jgi:exosome complex component CSL4